MNQHRVKSIKPYDRSSFTLTMSDASETELLVSELIARLKEYGVLSVRKLSGVEEHVRFPLPSGLGGNAERGSSIGSVTS